MKTVSLCFDVRSSEFLPPWFVTCGDDTGGKREIATTTLVKIDIPISNVNLGQRGTGLTRRNHNGIEILDAPTYQ